MEGGVKQLKRSPGWSLYCVRFDCAFGVMFKGGVGNSRDVYLFCGL